MAAGDKKIKVLIVDDVAETRENIRKLLQFENDFEVIGAVGSGRAGIDAAKELKPDVVLMDINMPDMDGIKATEVIRQNNPSTQIVILSVQGDPNYMRRAMLVGARDFITKPPSLDDLNSAIRQAGKMAQAERAKVSLHPGITGTTATSPASTVPYGKIIVVYSPKGGTGVTTLAVNLAVSLHNEETPVVIVDGNMQFGDVAVFMNEQARNSILDLAPRAEELDIDIVNEVMITNTASGVRILACPARPEYAENITGDQFTKVLKFLCNFFSYVVVDGSSALTDVILAAMDISNLIVLITTQDIPSIKNARLFLDIADVMKIEKKRILFIMNRFDKRIGILPEKISENLKHDIATVFPLEERVVLPSVNRGIPFMLGDRTRPIAKSMLSLAELVRQRINEVSVVSSDNVTTSPKKISVK
jgi:pilus assembly protein CpaE